jgi:hypothetical protein
MATWSGRLDSPSESLTTSVKVNIEVCMTTGAAKDGWAAELLLSVTAVPPLCDQA